MDVSEQIRQLIETIKADKSIVQPWRNYALKEANVLQALVAMGQATSNLTPPEGQVPESARCTCPAGGIRRDCPVHQTI